MGTSATRDAYSTSGKILSENDFGVGAISTAEDARHDSFGYTAFVRIASGSNNGFVTQNGALGYRISRGADNKVVNVWDASTNEVYFRKMMNATYGNWYKYYTSANTTTTSDGTLKAASPVARIVKSQAECQRTDIDESGFVWCGCGTANAEAEGIKISRLDVGVYVLIGSAGLASEGWQLLPPMDPGGMGELGVVEAEQTESGGLTIRLFKRKYMLSDEGEIVKTKGAPMDVPANSWIDVRLDMPDDSIWNKRQKESSEAALQEPAS